MIGIDPQAGWPVWQNMGIALGIAYSMLLTIVVVVNIINRNCVKDELRAHLIK